MACNTDEGNGLPSRPKSLSLQDDPNADDDVRHSWPPSASNISKKGSTKLKRQGRVDIKPELKLKIEGKERMRQETKLVILEYLSGLPPEKISARYVKPHGPTNVLKARTIHSSERPFLDVIEKKKKTAVTRRNSEEHDKKVRDKLLQMAQPLKKQLTPEILSDTKQLDKSILKKENGRKKLKIHGLPYGRIVADSPKKVLDSPIASVTVRLDEMSQDIMKDYPQLLDEHLTELLTPLEKKDKLTYEEFSVVAKSVFEKQLARFTGSIWTKVAMVFYLVKEVLYSGNLTDIQVELLVDYATRFITETSSERIKKEGGWVALNDDLIDQDIFQQDIYNPLGVQDDRDFVDAPTCHAERLPSTDKEEKEVGYVEMVTNTVKQWTTYSAAALAVGIGFAYAYLKQQ